MCSFDGADLGTNSEVLVIFSVRCQNVCGTFVERLLLYCFDITRYMSGSVTRFSRRKSPHGRQLPSAFLTMCKGLDQEDVER